MKDPNYPKTVEISKNVQPYETCVKNPDFDKPLSEIFKDYSQKQSGVLIFKVR